MGAKMGKRALLEVVRNGQGAGREWRVMFGEERSSGRGLDSVMGGRGSV